LDLKARVVIDLDFADYDVVLMLLMLLFDVVNDIF